MRKTIHTEEHEYIVERLVGARKDSHLDQKDVAKLLKVYPSCLCKIESGQRRLDIVDLMTFAKLYKKQLLYFIEKYIDIKKEYEYLKNLMRMKGIK